MAGESQYEIDLERHYTAAWGRKVAVHRWPVGPGVPERFGVMEFAPRDKTSSWVYATCGMSPLDDPEPTELFLLSPVPLESHVELLTAIAHYHQTGSRLGLHQTVSFGRPWIESSRCTCGLICHPYPFGPELEFTEADGLIARVLWLLPITPGEREYKVATSVSALEDLFDSSPFNYLDPMREPVIEVDAR